MSTICPTVTASNPHTYRQQIERVDFAKRLHIDISDGKFAPHHLLAPAQLWWPKHHTIDVHVMYEEPGKILGKLIALKPDLVILQAEAKGNFFEFANRLHAAHIKVGLALLQQTPAELIDRAMNEVDHVLIFSGSLGQFGGQVDPDLLDKVEVLRRRRPNIEIGWDGGVSPETVGLLRAGGVDVCNVGGYIQRAEEPKSAYAKLVAVTEKAARR